MFEHIHSKKKNRLVLSRLNDLVYIKYNRTLTRRYDAHDTIDPIALDNIDQVNEWLVGFPKDQEDELVYEGGDLNWGTVATAAGVKESIYHLRGCSSSRSRLDKEKGKVTSSSQPRTRLVDKTSDEEHDEMEFNEQNTFQLQDFENLEEQ